MIVKNKPGSDVQEKDTCQRKGQNIYYKTQRALLVTLNASWYHSITIGVIMP